MDLHQLNTFLNLSQILNFTRTAKHLNCAQSGVTAQIKQLESELHVKLFERIGKNISLTQEGQQLVPYAAKMLGLADEIKQLYHAGGGLTIGVSEVLLGHFLLDIIKEYRAMYPDIELHLKLTDNEDYHMLLAAGSIDAVFLLDVLSEAPAQKRLGMLRENIYLLCAFTHGMAGKNQVEAQDLAHMPLLLTPTGCPYRNLFTQELLSQGVRPNIVLETNSIHAITESCLCGLGLALLPDFTVKKELACHSLEKLNYKMSYPIYSQLLIHKDKWISPSLDAFLNIAAKYFESP